MYLGMYPSTCSSKNQVSFPKKLQEIAGTSLIVTSWFEKSLVVLAEKDALLTLEKVLRDSSSLLPEARDLERFLLGNASSVMLDVKGRFVVPSHLKTYAQLGNEVIFLGINDRIELWDKEIYSHYGAIREKQIRETAITHYNRITKQK